MVKNHLKKLNVPKTWAIKRKENTFISRPLSCGQKMQYCLPLNVVLRDMLKIGKTTKEIKHLLNSNDILINGRKILNTKFALGIMDVLEIKQLNEAHRLLINKKGKLALIKISDKEKHLLPLKLKNKTKIKGGKLQINFTNGLNLLVEKDEFKVQGVIIYDFVTKKVLDNITLSKGNTVYLTGGKYVGSVVKIEGTNENTLIFKDASGEVFKTSLKYAFLVGKDKPLINVSWSNK